MEKLYKLVLVIGLMLWLSGESHAQQLAMSSLYVENPYLYNPAVAGSDNGFRIRMNNRFQWMGFGDSPITNQISAYGPHKSRNIGYGGNISYDVSGPTSTFRMNGGFATNFAITMDIRMSVGLNFGFLQYRADGTRFTFYDDIEDPYAPEQVLSSFQPDAGAGLYVYHHDWYFGASVQQLFMNNIRFVKGENSKRNRLKMHMYIYGGYKFYSVNQHWVFEPTLMMRKVGATPFQTDVIFRAIYNTQIMGGLNIRNTFQSFDDLALLFGYIHNRQISVSLAYDYSFNKMRKYNAGTIELVVGYNFDNIRHGR